MKKERERKFLVFPSDLQAVQQPMTAQRIHDVYFEPAHDGSPPLRLRWIAPDLEPKNERLVLTAKLGDRVDADEHEWFWPVGFSCPNRPFQGIWLYKLRHEWTEGDLLFHIEQIYWPQPPEGEPNLIAEVEFPSAEARDAFTPPAHWIEVTHDKRYSNYMLAKYGWPVETRASPL